MTTHRFRSIAQNTAQSFWHNVYAFLSPEEKTYLRATPAARRNLDKRLLRALAETLLSPDQLSKFYDLELEDPQADIENPQSGLQTVSKELPQ